LLKSATAVNILYPLNCFIKKKLNFGVQKMKKVLISILAIVYLAVSSGVVVEMHYCMGKLAGIELYGGNDEKCGRCGMIEKKSGCCHDELKIYKLNDAHKNVTNATSFEAAWIAIVHHYDAYTFWLEPVHPAVMQTPVHAPPDIGNPPIHIANCVFRI
jgi:hypothetical protein